MSGGRRGEIIRLVNAERHRHGLRPLTESRALRTSANAKARDMVRYGYFSHGTPHGSWYAFLYRYAGKRWSNIGENIGQGQPSAEAVETAWQQSPEHEANILGRYRSIGVGFARRSDGALVWVQHFGASE